MSLTRKHRCEILKAILKFFIGEELKSAQFSPDSFPYDSRDSRPFANIPYLNFTQLIC